MIYKLVSDYEQPGETGVVESFSSRDTPHFDDSYLSPLVPWDPMWFRKGDPKSCDTQRVAEDCTLINQLVIIPIYNCCKLVNIPIIHSISLYIMVNNIPNIQLLSIINADNPSAQQLLFRRLLVWSVRLVAATQQLVTLMKDHNWIGFRGSKRGRCVGNDADLFIGDPFVHKPPIFGIDHQLLSLDLPGVVYQHGSTFIHHSLLIIDIGIF